MFGSCLYEWIMYPLERLSLESLRSEYISRAAGRVLELGAGPGSNLRFYNHSRIDSLIVSDLNVSDLLATRAAEWGAGVSEIDISKLPFATAEFDTVVFSLLFCSVQDPVAGLAEIRRVLKPEGEIIFLEHVLGCGRVTRGLQRTLTPLWRRMAGNCHLDRDTAAVIREAGFKIEEFSRRAGCVITAGVARR